MRMAKVLLYALLLLTTAVGCSTVTDDDDEVKEYVRVGDRLPVFTVETVNSDGTAGVFSSDRLMGETIIVFFHTTCPDCQRDLPKLDSYYRQHRGDDGFQLVAISRAEGAESVAAYWKEHDLTMPYSAQTDRRVYDLFASAMIPRVYYCTAQGIVTRIDIEKVTIPFSPHP